MLHYCKLYLLTCGIVNANLLLKIAIVSILVAVNYCCEFLVIVVIIVNYYCKCLIIVNYNCKLYLLTCYQDVVVDEGKAAVFAFDAFGVLPHFFFPGLLKKIASHCYSVCAA